MSDSRVTRSQHLFWEIDALRQLGAHRAAVNLKRREAARLLEDRACELLAKGDMLGFTDLFAAVTHWGEAGEREHAERLLSHGERWVDGTEAAIKNLQNELNELRVWLRELRVLPALAAFARQLPMLPRVAA